ncbi:uncharacterized protein A4U43_C02F4240 [Asparagus officinalis]|uniref:Plant heme peroxidase family profile domain-containing protein n=2 Tax=Asparagus officinalis TaxID=4686 RepID=A0A5P1FGH8_ASPOF|nr:uncharacterized protein A4U43_C02F4240 [Asparagus officinalis]
MASDAKFSTCTAWFCIVSFACLASAQLSPSFYETSCPGALYTIHAAVRAAVAKERRMGASLLRLHFHYVLGGPSWTVQLGRRDATTASFSAANNDIPSPTSDLSALISAFSKKGLSTTDLVALSGAHTIGQARCTTFRARIYNESNIDSSLASSLQSNCPSSGSDDNLSPLDAVSPNFFDNAYYRDLVNNKGLLHSDQQLFSGGSVDSQTKSYSTNFPKFYSDFASAMVNMGNISPLTGSNGEIRINCRKTN